MRGSSGFSVCCECGAASVYDSYSPAKGAHERPYKYIATKETPRLCSGEYKRVFSDMISVLICFYYE